MRSILTPHPDHPCDTVRGIAVDVRRPAPGQLVLRYLIAAAPDGLIVPPPAEPARTDGLWRHTCFEAFVRAPDGEAYAELNLAPSGQWAAYAFDRYRDGMAEAAIPDPQTAWRRTADGFELNATADLSGLGLLPPAGPWRLGLTAVIEEAATGAHSRTSYWALAHPPGKADFHRNEGFALTLPGPPAA